MNWPAGTWTGRVTLKLALPLLLAVTVVEPRNVCPSPLPEGSLAVFAKNWRVNVAEALLLSVPWIVVLEGELRADVTIGKFWRLLAPRSPSPVSSGVTPGGLRSIPRPPLEKI